MSNVVDIASRRPKPDDPHGAGHALCLACEYKWIAVAPIGTVGFDCPKCRASCGIWAAPFGLPATEYAEYACRCGCRHFAAAIGKDGACSLMCRHCGRFHDPANLL